MSYSDLAASVNALTAQSKELFDAAQAILNNVPDTDDLSEFVLQAGTARDASQASAVVSQTAAGTSTAQAQLAANAATSAQAILDQLGDSTAGVVAAAEAARDQAQTIATNLATSVDGLVDQAEAAVVAAQAVATNMVGSVDALVDQAEAARDKAIATTVIHSFTQSFNLAPAASATFPVKVTTAPLVLHKISTLLTQVGLSNVDVELKVGTNLVYRAEGLAKSVDSTFSLFTEHLGQLTLTVTNNGLAACAVQSTLFWCDL